MKNARSIKIIALFSILNMTASQNKEPKVNKQSIMQSVDRALTGMQTLEKSRPRDMRYVRPIIRKLQAAYKEMKDYFSGAALQVEDTVD